MMAGYETPPFSRLLLWVSLCWFCYITVLDIYRLYFSPLAKFSGPKLAALTQWYEFYYEVIKKGQFLFHTQDLHKQYGWLAQAYEHLTRESRLNGVSRAYHSHYVI